eukprot:g28599.t1
MEILTTNKEGCEPERVTIPGSEGLQFKVSLSMDGVAILCSDLLPVHRFMTICDPFELASGAQDRLPEGAGNMVWRGWGMDQNLGGVHSQGKFATKNTFDHVSIGKWSACSILETLWKKERVDSITWTHTETNINWRTISSVKDTLWSTRTLLVFQSKELTLTECYRLAHSKAQDYVLRDALKLG